MEPQNRLDNARNESASQNGSDGDKRGRLIAAAALVAVGGAFLAAGVAGIFQMVSRFTAKCPADVSINDPAPELWKKLVAPDLGDQKLGVPDTVAPQVAFKSGPK